MRQIKFGTAFLTALLLLNSAASFAQKDLPLNPGVKDALYLIDTEQPAKAVVEIQKVVASLPTDASLLYYQGYIQIKTGDKAGALASFDKGIALNDKEPLNYVGKGYLNMLDKKPVDAKAQFDKALAMCKSKSVAVLKGVAEAYNTDNKYSVESVSLLNKAKGLNAEDIDVPILLGDTYFIQNAGGNVGQSVSSYENALMVKVPDPKIKHRGDAKAEYKIGMVYEKAKNNEVALEDFQKSVAADPSYTSSYQELGQLYYLHKEYAKAVEAYTKYLSLTEKPDTYQYQYEYAYLLFANKEYAKANSVFEKISNGAEVKALTYKFYAKSLFEAGDFEKSAAMTEKFLATAKPDEIDANDYLYYARTLQKIKQDTPANKAKQDSLALVYFQKSIDLNKEQPSVLLDMVNLSYKYKKFPQAISIYKQLISIRKAPNAQDYYSIGRAYYSNEQFPQADTAFLKFIEMQPTIAPGYVWEARTKSKFDPDSDQGLAKPFFEKFIELASPTPDKFKNDLIEAYGYMGYYYFLKKDVSAAKAAYSKVLELNPAEPNAKVALDQLNNVGKAPVKPVKKTK